MDVLRVADLAERLEEVVELAAAIKDDAEPWLGRLRHQTMVALFERPSTRTRVAFAAAAHRLGMLPLFVGPEELQLGRGEPVGDTARSLSAYASAIVVRARSHESIEELAAAASVPVINALSDRHHPCEAVASLLTLREHFGRLKGLRLAYVGEGNNVAHSLLEAGALAGASVAGASPPEFTPDPQVVAAARILASEKGGAVEVGEDPVAAVTGADAVFTDVWPDGADDRFAPFRVDAELMRHASPQAVFVHCLPARRGEEVTADVLDGPTSLVWQQVANHLPVAQALLYLATTSSTDRPSR
jgi:ornithine carbamoyltransferase